MVSRASHSKLSYDRSHPLGDYIINLDHRNLKTPGGAKLVVPKDRRLMALLIANEWENQSEVLKQHSLPVVRLLDHNP